MNKKKLNKFAMFTDLHVGAKSNSEQHNQDCHDYIDWFCDNVRADADIDHIIFGGDWHEVRNSINIFTLKHSYEMAKKINDLGLPVYFIIGNHDLYHRSNRDVYSTYSWEGFDNFIMIDEPMVVDNMGDGVLMCPYLFHEEYPSLANYKNIPMWVGHFEFKGFVVTGYNITMKSGPDHTDFQHQKHIISGHFHKRQTMGNTTYIGNTFPTNFADAGDFERGMMIFDHNTDSMDFKNWEMCPKYIKGKLSDVLEDRLKLYPQARVQVVADIPINYEESIEIRKRFIEDNDLREFTITESTEIAEALAETETEVEVELEGELGSVDEMVVDMLNEIESEHIDNEMLSDIYINL
jgi:DNA repair exonuclease SbcCD nuclease subunit